MNQEQLITIVWLVDLWGVFFVLMILASIWIYEGREQLRLPRPKSRLKESLQQLFYDPESRRLFWGQLLLGWSLIYGLIILNSVHLWDISRLTRISIACITPMLISLIIGLCLKPNVPNQP